MALLLNIHFVVLPHGSRLVQSTHIWQSVTDTELEPEPRPISRNAYMTFLAAPSMEETTDDDDLYYVATRMLTYQLLHDEKTRTQAGFPVVVVVTPDVAQSKRERLTKDGAIVTEIDLITSDWIISKVYRWRDVLSKLRIFEMTEYDKIAFFDSDTILMRPMDGIFDDEAAITLPNLGKPEQAREDEGPQPMEYLFAGNAGSGEYNKTWPPPEGRNNINAGCMVFKPSKDLFDYYMRVASIKNRFDPRYPEQNLWKYVHRRDGNMPWRQLNYMWNTNRVTYQDALRGVASLHTKFWENDHDPPLRDLCMRIRWRMEGFWQRADADLAVGLA